MTDAASIELGEFFDYLWSDTEGYAYLPVEADGSWQGYWFRWPKQRQGVIRHVLKWSAIKANVFFSPALYSATSAKKENVLGSWSLWCDFDGNAPAGWDSDKVPPPTLRIQSSIPGHEHCYWRLDEFLTDVAMIDDRNRALAYLLHADTSGWDADQILRPIHTMNHKRGVPVTVRQWFE